MKFRAGVDVEVCVDKLYYRLHPGGRHTLSKEASGTVALPAARDALYRLSDALQIKSRTGLK